MPEPTYINIPDTKHNAVAWSHLGVIALNLLNEYQRNYASFGRYQGTDQYGKAYDAAFVPPFLASLATLVAVSLGMHDVGSSIFATAHLFENSNDVNLGIVPQIHR